MIRTRLLLAAIAAIPFGVATSGAGTAAPSSFELVFDGQHVSAEWSPNGFTHVGSFTASTPFCSSGSMTTLGVTGTSGEDHTATRLLTCADGSGSATALVSIDVEHPSGFAIPGGGAWRIVSGTGEYAKLRGRGTFRSTLVGGDTRDHGSLTFRSTWAGVADLDDVPPEITVTRAAASKLRSPVGAYVVRVAFSAQKPGNTVRYRITVAGRGLLLATRAGETGSGSVSAAIRLRVLKGVRRLHIEIAASDPLGNESSQSRDIALTR